MRSYLEQQVDWAQAIGDRSKDGKRVSVMTEDLEGCYLCDGTSLYLLKTWRDLNLAKVSALDAVKSGWTFARFFPELLR
jgi:hypothetical protein